MWLTKVDKTKKYQSMHVNNSKGFQKTHVQEDPYSLKISCPYFHCLPLRQPIALPANRFSVWNCCLSSVLLLCLGVCKQFILHEVAIPWALHCLWQQRWPVLSSRTIHPAGKRTFDSCSGKKPLLTFFLLLLGTSRKVNISAEKGGSSNMSSKKYLTLVVVDEHSAYVPVQKGSPGVWPSFFRCCFWILCVCVTVDILMLFAFQEVSGILSQLS